MAIEEGYIALKTLSNVQKRVHYVPVSHGHLY